MLKIQTKHLVKPTTYFRKKKIKYICENTLKTILRKYIF